MSDEHLRRAMEILGMAWTRGHFKDELEKYLRRAILHFYKLALAEKNGQTRLVKHWRSEFVSVLGVEFHGAIRHSVTFGSKAKWRAMDEVVDIVKSDDVDSRKQAEHLAKQTYGDDVISMPLSDSDTAAFWGMVEDEASRALGERSSRT